MARKRKVRSLRDAQRFPTSIQATIRSGYDLHDITIADISAGGAKIRCMALVPIGTMVPLETRHETIEACVVWRSDRGYGLRFMTQVEPLAIVRRNLPGLRQVFGDRASPWSDTGMSMQPLERRRA